MSKVPLTLRDDRLHASSCAMACSITSLNPKNKPKPADESKTHLFLSLFFLHFCEFKVQFNAELWNLHPVLHGFNAKEATKNS